MIGLFTKNTAHDKVLSEEEIGIEVGNTFGLWPPADGFNLRRIESL